MKRILILILALIFVFTPLLSVNAEEDVIFEGDFSDLTLVVGKGSDEDILKGITAKDADGNDITSQLTYTEKIDFDTIGNYPIMYKISGKTSFKTRIVRIIEDSGKSDLIQRNIDHGRNYFQTLDFGAVAGTDRALIYEIYESRDDDGNYKTLKYSWLMEGKDIKSPYPDRFNVNIFNTCKNADDIKKAVGKVDYKIVSFDAGNVSFPASAEVTLSVGDVFDKSDSLYLYKYTDEKLTLVADSINVRGRHVTYTFTKGGDYVFTNKKAGYRDPEVSSSSVTSSATTSSKAPVSSAETSSAVISSEETVSEVTSSEVTSSELTVSEVTSSENTQSGADVSTVLLVIILSALGLMAITIIAFAIVRKNV